MSWRFTQLGNSFCDQDKLILSLFNNMPVNYVGTDREFQNSLLHDPVSPNLILVLNNPIWISGIFKKCQQCLTSNVKTFYIGINRYQVLGNDTNVEFDSTDTYSKDLIKLLTNVAEQQGFTIDQSGHHDQDLGRYFNFVQPLTWVYGHNITNQSN